MSDERIFTMAELSGGVPSDNVLDGGFYFRERALLRFAKMIALDCAGLCDMYGMPDGTSQTAMILSAAIRARYGVDNNE